MGELTNYGYEGTVLLPVPLTINGVVADGASVRVKADWLVCKDTCIPESAVLEKNWGDHANDDDITLLDKTLARVPYPSSQEAFIRANESQVQIAVHSPDARDVLPIDDGWFSNSAEAKITHSGDWTGFTLSRASGELKDTFSGVIEVADKTHEYLQITATKVESFPTQVPASLFAAPTETSSMGLITALLLAFLGGLILNLMPCVLPVLSLKVLALSRKADASHAKAVGHGLAYSAGVLTSFLAIGGTLLLLKSGGEAIGWGFQLQSPTFVLGLLIVVFLVALNLLGLFELPVLLGNRGSEITSRDSALGSFATGVLAVALATPCTAPFMAPALGAALTYSALPALLIFASLGLGLALPYLLVSISPALRGLLPKPGAWMQNFKELLAFPMLATAAWLLWVLVQQAGDMALLSTLTRLITITLALWGLKRMQQRFWRSVWMIVLIGSIACALVYPPALSAPHVSVSDSAHANSAPYNAKTLEELRAAGTPVFVDATAAWCITCKVNERVALSDARIQKLFSDKGITLMVADWTRRDANITALLTSFKRSGVPLYIYYPPHKDPVVLPQLLTPEIVAGAITSAN